MPHFSDIKKALSHQSFQHVFAKVTFK